jgi:two-component system, NarL family, invasion response regulator UvrY
MIRVLVVDDHEMIRRGICAILGEGATPIEFVEAGTGDAALAALEPTLDLVILDLSMPGRSGLDLLSEIKFRLPDLPVLVVSAHGEELFALRAYRAGASGYLTKTAAPTALVAAVAKIVGGGRYVSDAMAEALVADAQRPSAPGAPHDRLSEREFEVMRGIASGESVGTIAIRMHLSIKTVSTYRTRLLEKMGMSTNAEVTRYAIHNGLV